MNGVVRAITIETIDGRTLRFEQEGELASYAFGFFEGKSEEHGPPFVAMVCGVALLDSKRLVRARPAMTREEVKARMDAKLIARYLDAGALSVRVESALSEEWEYSATVHMVPKGWAKDIACEISFS